MRPAQVHLGTQASASSAPCRSALLVGRSSDGRRPVATARSAAAEGSAGRVIESFQYNDSDGKRQKATIEHVFTPLRSPSDDDEREASSSGRTQTPWGLGWQMNERNVMWNDDLKLRLINRIAADELGLSDAELEGRLQQLGALLPGLEARLAKAPAKLVARLAANTGEVALRLLQLKETFPQADLSLMINNRLTLLLDDDLVHVAAAAGRLRQLLPDINVDRFAQTFPVVLDVECFEMALEDARRIMPGIDVTQMLRANPDVILSLVKGKNMIPYDQIENPFVKAPSGP